MSDPSKFNLSQEFAKDLEDWFWEFGSQRTGRFMLPTGGWLKELRDLRDGFDSTLPSLEQEKPAVAIWGPSQTGKSTSVSSYMDEEAVFAGDYSEDGKGSALHWEGGDPAYFIHPSLTKGAPKISNHLVLNPFNSGLDASACLSRFVNGSLEKGVPGTRYIPDAQFPIGIQLVRSYELWMSLARGYSSQCWGPKPDPETDEHGRPVPRYQTVWTQDNFQAAFNGHASQVVETRDGVNRTAFERLHLVCRLIQDMIFAGLPRYRQLSSGDLAWSKFSEKILTDTVEDGELPNALLYSEEIANDFIAEILWDNYDVVTEYALAIDGRLSELLELFGGKPIYCSIEMAALFLDMETYKVYLMRPSPVPEPKEEKYRKLLSDMRWEDRGEYIALGCDSTLANPLLDGPEDFGIIQGLVWELVIGVNRDNLADNAFKSFIEKADLLDFPGVERGGKESPADRIDLDILTEKKRRGEYLTQPNPTGHDPLHFFCKLLKRGKTSSIVCTYAQRMNIDIFNIFQDIDKDKPNGDELVTGINTWWQACVPDYFRNQKGKSPMPLNHVLLWWSEFFSAGHNFTSISMKLEPVGQISNPEVSTAFAMNYYYIPKRGEMEAGVRESIPEKLKYLKGEAAFSKKFLTNKTSEASFDVMLADTKTGGAEYFFTEVAKQADDVIDQGDDTPRIVTLKQRYSEQQKQLESLVQVSDLVPELKEADTRRETLIAVRERITAAITEADLDTIECVEAGLRFLLNVDDRSLRQLPHQATHLNPDLIHDQVQSWIRSQASRPLASFPGGAGEGLSMIGLDEPEARTAFLRALVESVDSDITDLTKWLEDLLLRHGYESGSKDLRRFLAVALSNLFTRVKVDDPFGQIDAEPEALDSLMDGDESPLWELKGTDLPRYNVFLKPLVGEGGVLETLALKDLKPVTRPDQPGDEQLLDILNNHASA